MVSRTVPDRDPSSHRPPVGVVVLGFVGGGRRIEEPGALHQPENPPGVVVHQRFGQPVLAHGFDQLGSEMLRRTWHLDVESCESRLDGAVGAEPIGYDCAVETPLFLEDLAEQLRVLARVSAVDRL